MANWFKEEIDHLGNRLENAITKAGEEIGNQRSLTRADLEHLIRYAAEQLGETLDVRIEKARRETSELISHKIEQLREQLGEAAVEQKKATISNLSLTVATTLLVGLVSLLYRRYDGGLDLISVFRSLLWAFSAGYVVWGGYRLWQTYRLSGPFKRNAVMVGLRYFDILRPKGAWGHLVLLALLGLAWVLAFQFDWLVNFWHSING